MNAAAASVSASERPDASAPTLTIEGLYKAHFGFVCRSALRLGTESAWVDDIAQEAFVVAARRLREFEGRSSVRTWLFAITMRVVQSHRRWLRRQRRKVDAYVEASPRGSTHDPYDRVHATDTLVQLLQRLPEDLRTVYILGELEGMSSAEIGRGLGLNPNTTYSRLRKGRVHMKREVRRFLDEENQT